MGFSWLLSVCGELEAKQTTRCASWWRCSLWGHLLQKGQGPVAGAGAGAYPRLALLVHLHLTVPEPGSHESTSRTIEPSAHKICDPG